MRDPFVLREGRPEDLPALERLYPAAFPTEDLLPLVRDLSGAGDGVLSLVAVDGGDLVGHVAFTRCGVGGRSERVDMLAPLAVAPARRREGIGGALVREGLRRLTAAGGAAVLVLGDPAYYRRFGFLPDRDVAAPHLLPEEWRDAWQSVRLAAVEPPFAGGLEVPPFWSRPELWAP